MNVKSVHLVERDVAGMNDGLASDRNLLEETKT